jgi:BON domain
MNASLCTSGCMSCGPTALAAAPVVTVGNFEQNASQVVVAESEALSPLTGHWSVHVRLVSHHTPQAKVARVSLRVVVSGVQRMDLEAQVNEAGNLQREATAWPAERCSILGRRTHFAILFVLLLGGAGSDAAEEAARRTGAPREEVVVRSTRLADEQITQQAQKAISNDPWVYSEHITVTTEKGIIRVEGIVQDTDEWYRILDLCRKIRGARRVDSSRLEMLHNDPEGG